MAALSRFHCPLLDLLVETNGNTVRQRFSLFANREKKRERGVEILPHSHTLVLDMYQPRVFCVKLQLHFGGDIYEISVPAYDGAEPTVNDLMNVIERDYRVPRALQNIVFHGQELHSRANESLSRFGIKNGAPIRLVGRMVPPDMVQQINSQYSAAPYPNYVQPTTATYSYQTSENNMSYYNPPQYIHHTTTGTQYDPPNHSAPPEVSPVPPTPASQRSNNDDVKPPATPNTSTMK